MSSVCFPAISIDIVSYFRKTLLLQNRYSNVNDICLFPRHGRQIRIPEKFLEFSIADDFMLS